MAMLTYEQMYNSSGSPRFSRLIIELIHTRADRDPEEAIFTVRNFKEGYISLKNIFVSHTAKDPSEAAFAEEVFGDVGYWLRVRDTKELQKYLAAWREEAEVIRKSIAFKALYKEVAEDGKASFSAAKYLIDEPWKPTKEKRESKKTTKRAADVSKKVFEEDYERLKGIIQ